MKKITIDPITRLEGHGKIEIFLNDAGEVENSYYSRGYTPTRVMNVTVVFYNPSSETCSVEHEVVLKSSVAPGDKVRNIAYWATPIGIILTIPWLANLWKQRKQS